MIFDPVLKSSGGQVDAAEGSIGDRGKIGLMVLDLARVLVLDLEAAREGRLMVS